MYKTHKYIQMYIAFYNYDYLHDKTMLYVRIVKNKTVRLCRYIYGTTRSRCKLSVFLRHLILISHIHVRQTQIQIFINGTY
jgi:hypothetical protein